MTTFNSAPLNQIVTHYRGFIININGVLRGPSGSFGGAVEVINTLRRMGKPMVFLSNTASRLPLDIARQLRDEGFNVSDEQIVTSGMALHPVFTEMHLVARPVISVGNEATEEYVQRAGADLSSDPEKAEAAVIGGYLNGTNRKQFEIAVRLARREKPVLLTNTEMLALANEYEVRPGPGQVGQEYWDRTGRLVYKVGKPFPYMYRLALERMPELEKGAVLMIGDSINFDVLGAWNEGIDSLLVLSGLQGIITPGSKLDEHLKRCGIYPTYIHATLSF